MMDDSAGLYGFAWEALGGEAIAKGPLATHDGERGHEQRVLAAAIVNRALAAASEMLRDLAADLYSTPFDNTLPAFGDITLAATHLQALAVQVDEIRGAVRGRGADWGEG